MVMLGLSVIVMEFCDIAFEQRHLLVFNEHISSAHTHLDAALPRRTDCPKRLSVLPTQGPKVSYTSFTCYIVWCTKLWPRHTTDPSRLTCSFSCRKKRTQRQQRLYQLFIFSATNVHLSSRYVSLKKSSPDPKCEPRAQHQV